MTNENRTPGTASTAEIPGRELPRVFAWVLLLAAVGANASVPVLALPVALGVVSGLVALTLGALLVRDHHRRARSAR